MGITKRKRSYLYMEYLRVICAMAVIAIHVSGENWFKLEIGATDWVVQTFFNVASRFSVCVFAMISGALLLRPERELSMHDILSRYVKRILICYVAWTVFYALFYTALNHEGAQYFVTRLFSLPDHLWYLMMLIGLYLAYPVARLITKNRDVTRYLILLLVGWGTVSCLTGVTEFFSERAGDSLGFSMWTSFLNNLGEMKLGFVPGYFGCFLLGHYIHEYGLGAWHKRIVFATIPAMLISPLLTVWVSGLTGSHVYTFMLETNPLVILASAGLFAFFRGEDKSVRLEEPGSQISKAMVWVAGNTFGVYLIHFAVRDVLSKGFGFNVASCPAIVSVPLNTVLIFGISLGLTVLVKKIPVVNRIVS